MLWVHQALAGHHLDAAFATYLPFELAPQWSPPLGGGATDAQAMELLRRGLPQWSPPLGGGTISGWSGTSPVFSGLPQWSLPAVAGTTPDIVAQLAYPGVAALAVAAAQESATDNAGAASLPRSRICPSPALLSACGL